MAALVVVLTTGARAAPAAEPAFVPAVYGSDQELESRFKTLRALRTDSDENKLERAFAELMQAKFAANWTNIEPFSKVLVRDAEDAASAGNPVRGQLLLHFARDLSPSLLEPRVQLVLASIVLSPTNVGSHVREILSAVRVLLSDFPAVTRFVANTASVGLLALLVGCFAVLAMLLARQWRYVAHDVTLLMPKNSSSLLAYGLFVLFIGLPFGLRFGLLGVAFVVVLLPFIHMDTSERITASIAFVVIIVTPLAIPLVADTWVRVEGRARDLYALTRTAHAEDAKVRIEKNPGANESFDAQFALGLYAKRKAELDLALKHFLRAAALDATRADVWVNIGAIHFLLNRTAEADKAFEKAESLDAKSVAVHFNMSRMLYKAGEAERGTTLLAAAQGFNAERTGAYVTISRMIGPRYMVEETLPAQSLWNAAPYAHEPMLALAATESIEHFLIGSVPRDVFAMAAAGFLVLLWAIALAMRHVQTALPCPRCGRAICLRTDKDLPDRSLCGQCYHAFVLADVETSMRIAKEIECRRHERRRMQLVALMSIVFAGAGHLLRGRSRTGALFCLIAATAWMLALTGSDIVPLPMRFGASPIKVPMLIIAGVLWLGASIAALITVPKKD